MITSCQLQELEKQGQPVFLAIIRPTNDVPRESRSKGGNKKYPIYAAETHGLTEGQKRKINKGMRIDTCLSILFW